MATVFTPSPTPGSGFEARPLGANRIGIDATGNLLEQVEASTPVSGGVIVPESDAAHLSGQKRWYLVASPAANIFRNGLPVQSTGIAALEHRDELVFHGPDGPRRLFFSDREAPVPEVLPDDVGDGACCPCCQLPLAGPAPGVPEDEIPEKPVIRCPDCGTLFHHQPCWSYAEACRFCGCATTSHKSWHPDELG